MMDLQSARINMVEGQVRPNQVHDGRIIAAMRALPREGFAPAGTNAYADIDLPLGEGRFMLAPMTIGRMAQLVLAEHPEHVLVIGAGSGYGAALLAASGVKSVVALEEEARLDTGALAKWAPRVARVSGPLAKGLPSLGPFDATLIEGAVADIPALLARQLKKKRPGGYHSRESANRRAWRYRGGGAKRKRLRMPPRLRLHRAPVARFPSCAGI